MPDEIDPVDQALQSVKKNRGFFQKGNKYGQGRPGKTRNQIEPIRRRILQVVRHRIFHEKDLKTVSTNDLLKFLSSIMPKDGMPTQATQINYISNVPRAEESLPAVETIAIENNTPLVTESLLEEKIDEPAL
jgi:hypothetical protein